MMMLAVQASPAWDRNRDKDSSAGMEAPEPGRVTMQLPGSVEPRTAGPARVGFAGLRKELERIVSTYMPGVPGGPPKIVARREQEPSGRSATMPIRASSVYAPALAVESTAPWWDFVQ